MSEPAIPSAKQAFLDALELSATERARFLAGLAPDVARAVDELLRAHDGRSARALEQAPRALRDALGHGSNGPVRAAGARFGDYELLEEVGHGAFGSVWRARQLSLDRIVALKLLRSGRLARAREHERLRAEAEDVARLDHPHIVPVYEVGEIDGLAYFSMKWIDGGSLAGRLAERWPPRLAARLVIDVARAMHHAHQRGLLHRDLKPSNVLLDTDGAPHVADFGIAKRLGAGAAHDTGSTGGLAGTPSYMAPEQIAGGELTVATDVWALGCLLYELLGARSAFGADTVGETLRRVREEEPAALHARLSDTPRDLETIVLVCLRKDPARRYASADALADDIQRWLDHEPIAARRTGAFERLQLAYRRSPLAATLIGLVSALVVLLAVVATWSSLELASRLRGLYVGQARALRLAAVPGARATALDLLARAAAIEPGPDLRDEAIACLALPDLELELTLARPAASDGRLWIDPALQRIALVEDGALRLHDARTGAALRELRSGLDPQLVRWSSDGRWLFEKGLRTDGGAARDGLRVWDVEAAAIRFARDELLAGRCVDFDAQAERCVYATRGGELVRVDLRDGAEELRAPLGVGAHALLLTPGGEEVLLALTGEHRALQRRRAQDGALLGELALDSEPYHLAWIGSGGDAALAVACRDGRVRIHDRLDAPPRSVLVGHAAEVVEALGSASGALLATYSWDETTRVWDVLTGRELGRLGARALGLDGTRLATADAHSWSVWRVEHGAVLRATRAHAGKSPVALACAPDGATLVSAGPDGVAAWNSGSGGTPRWLTANDSRCVAFLPADGALVYGGADGAWRVDPGAEGAPRRVLAEATWDLAASADGKWLAALGRDSVWLHDARSFERARTLVGAPGLEYLTLSADGSRVAAGNWRGDGVHLWDASDRPAELLFAGRGNLTPALSPDGALLAVSSGERIELVRVEDRATLLSIERGRNFGALTGPVVFRPDGAQLACGLADGVVRVIDTRTLRTWGDLTSPEPRAPALTQLAYSPDGRHLALASTTNLLQVWDLALLDAELTRRVGR